MAVGLHYASLSSVDGFRSIDASSYHIHSALLNCFLCGMYTSVFGFMLFMICKERNIRRHPVNVVVVVQYAMVMVYALIQVGYMLSRVYFDVDPLLAVRYAWLHSPVLLVMQSACLYVSIMLGDGLIIRRCCKIWNKNMFIIVTLTLPLTAEVGLFTYYLYLITPSAKANLARNSGTVIEVATYLAVSLTVLASLLIIIRIWKIGPSGSMRRYKMVIEIIVESALLYSIPLALCRLFSSTQSHINANSAVWDTTGAVMTGLAPLLLIARISLGLARPNESWNVSISFNSSKEGETESATRA